MPDGRQLEPIGEHAAPAVGAPNGRPVPQAVLAAGRSNREIAGELFIGEATVKTHINNLFATLGLRDRAQAVYYAFTHGVV